MSKSPFDGFKINRFGKEIEPQETLLDSLAQRKEREVGVSEKKLETPISERTLLAVRLVIVFLFLVFFGRTFQLQIIEGKTFAELAEKNRFIIKTIQAERGVIYDENFRQLVFNKANFNFICSGQLAIENIDHQTLLKLKTSQDEYPDCEIEDNTVREYLSGSLFAHLIGYQRRTGETAGLEKYYDEILKHLNEILKKVKPEKIIINGDLKHEFGNISEQEWREVLKLLAFIGGKCNEVIIVKGNHDWLVLEYEQAGKLVKESLI